MQQGTKWQTGHPNLQKELKQSQLNKTDTGALERNGPTQMPPVRQPHTTRHDAPDRMMPQGSKQKTGRSNMHKAPELSQLSKINMGALE